MNSYDDLGLLGELGIDIAAKLNEHISTHYPWLPTRMDFSRIPNSSHLHWGSVSDDEVERFVHSSPLAEFEYVAVLHSASEPVLVYELVYAAKELERIGKGKPVFVVFGAVRDGSGWNVAESTFLYAHHAVDIWCTGGR